MTTDNNFPAEKKSEFNFEAFKIRNTNKMLILSILLFFLLCISVLKNISYPLFWADESMTAMGTERVLEFGYPKVHDGKNIFYDLRHSNPKLGISEKDDAYVGGAGWGQYYYGIIGYKLAEKTDDIYLKTGIYRSTFAFAGLLGLLLLGYFISRFFPDNFSKFTFIFLFLLFELLSISLAILLREVRYYSLVLLLSSLILGLYSGFRFYKPFHKIVFICVMVIALWMLFITFAPVYFIIILTIGISEFIFWIFQYSRSGFRTSVMKALPVILPLIVSFLLVIPLISYFKTFEISKAMSEYNGFTIQMYLDNLSTIFKYFKTNEFLLLAIALKIVLMLDVKKLLIAKSSLYKVSGLFTLFFIISFFAIANIPNFIFTRYIIYLQPFLTVIIILDIYTIIDHYSTNGIKLFNFKFLLPVIVLVGLFTYTLSNNLENIKGHIYEMSHVYKGPLDFTIPFIMEKFPKTDTLVIATNYEETSYMYYLKSKVVVGYFGSNLEADADANPHIIVYRWLWQNFLNEFNRYFQKAKFGKKDFPVYDLPFNNIPELNSKLSITHQFHTKEPYNTGTSAKIYVRQ